MSWVGFAKLHLGDDAEAVAWLRRSLKVHPNNSFTKFFLAAALAHQHSMDDARAAVKDGLAFDPAFTIRRFKAYPYGGNPTFLAGSKRIIKGMRIAGVPEQ